MQAIGAEEAIIGGACRPVQPRVAPSFERNRGDRTANQNRNQHEVSSATHQARMRTEGTRVQCPASCHALPRISSLSSGSYEVVIRCKLCLVRWSATLSSQQLPAAKPSSGESQATNLQPSPLPPQQLGNEPSAIQKFINPGADQLPDELSMPIWDHLEELRERVLISALAAGLAILTCFCFSKDLVVFLEAPVITQVSF